MPRNISASINTLKLYFEQQKDDEELTIQSFLTALEYMEDWIKRQQEERRREIYSAPLLKLKDPFEFNGKLIQWIRFEQYQTSTRFVVKVLRFYEPEKVADTPFPRYFASEEGCIGWIERYLKDHPVDRP